MKAFTIIYLQENLNGIWIYLLSVTSVKLASSAVSLLSKGKTKFDLLVESIKSPDACGYKLLQIALKMDLPVICEL